ncbi:PQQ-dependent catabolism-associated CXXCW motif protein [Acuticoccus sediminis]|uniref:PQQ-dependent catabolism-associated CXXCW motif protein n=1 Tax=Acuticoccus sediminis TaxID=2184697 RepID=UPI001CFF4DBD|nr:PQQ-dependent catabolism-associated CXXCW motif protein [Acuticoccus sediminis]
MRPPSRLAAAFLAAASLILASVAAVSVSATVPARADVVPEPEDYRGPPYRAPVPATLVGASVLTTAEAKALWETKAALFVDTLPTPKRPANLPEGTLWRAPPREDVPGSVWLANTGYDRLSTEMDAYYTAALAEITHGDADAPLVFYCLSECWMSWNAARRALEYGYTNVSWYPEGTDGWSNSGLPLEHREPYELTR